MRLARLAIEPPDQWMPPSPEGFRSKFSTRHSLDRQLSLPLEHQPRNWVLAGRKAVIEYIHSELANEPVEHLLALFLDSDLGLLKIKSIGKGSVHSVEFRLSEVLRDGIALDAAGLVLIHNHPSGIATPSSEDIAITKRIYEVCSCLDMSLLDHLIVTKTEISSVGIW